MDFREPTSKRREEKGGNGRGGDPCSPVTPPATTLAWINFRTCCVTNMFWGNIFCKLMQLLSKMNKNTTTTTTTIYYYPAVLPCTAAAAADSSSQSTILSYIRETVIVRCTCIRFLFPSGTSYFRKRFQRILHEQNTPVFIPLLIITCYLYHPVIELLHVICLSIS